MFLKKLKVFACLWLISAGWGYSQIADWKIHNSELCSIQYPETWTVKESSEDLYALGIQFSIISPAKKNGDDFFENMNLVAKNLESDEVTLEDYAESAPKLWKGILVGYKTLSKKIINTSNGPALSLVFSGKLDKQTLVWHQYVVFKNKMVYITSYTAKKKDYKSYKSIFEQMAASLLIK